MNARAFFLAVCAALLVGACAKKHDEATDDRARTMAKMLEAAERQGVDAGPVRATDHAKDADVAAESSR